MRIAIYGAGSLGTILGAYLSKGGADVELINRNQEHVRGLREKGAQVLGTVTMTVPVKALLPEQMSGRYDLVFLMTKQMDNQAAVRRIADFLAPDGVVCTMQNGLPERSVAEVIGPERTFGCAIAWGATMLGGGACELTSEPEALTFGLGSFAKGQDETLARIKALLELMGPVEIEKNFLGARWSKLLVNSAFSGLSAVLGRTFGEVAAAKDSRLAAQRIIKECIDVADAAGIEIEPIQGKDIRKLLDYSGPVKRAISFAVLPLTIRKHRLLKASMLQDLQKGRRCEIEAINGVVCAYGREQGVPTPYNDRVVEIVHGIEEGRRAIDAANIRLFDELR